MKKYLYAILPFVLLGDLSVAQKLNKKESKIEKNITSAITYLASDQLDGRLTGSEGEKLSADYIAAQFKSLGLTPMGMNGAFFQTFNITTLRIATDKSAMALGAGKLAQFKEFYPLSISANKGEYSGPTVDVSYGINSLKPVRNDYENVDVKGKLVLINLGSPDGIHPHSAFIAWHGIESRVNEAIKQGAKAVVFYKNDSKMEDPDGSLSLKIEPCAIPVVYVKKDLGTMPPGAPISLSIDILAIIEKGYNVIAFKNNNAANTVVIGAHHDHLGRGQMGNSLSNGGSEIHNGADDNASGTAGLIELARIFSKKKKWNKANNYLFIAFSGEELGLIGSKYFVANPTYPLENMNYMVNMDMIGKLDSASKVLIINGVGTSPAWNKTISTLKLDTNRIKSIVTTEGGIGASDHTSFYLKKIPAIHFFTGQHADYHKTTDDVAGINFGGEVYVIRYICDLISALNKSGKLAFTETKNEDTVGRMKFAVTLGIMPDYRYSAEGVRVDGVKDNMPGKVGGIEAGDIIISFNGVFIQGMKEYMNVLSSLKKGDKAPIQIKRNGETIDLTIQF
jgi:aminopeptidase YwaD